VDGYIASWSGNQSEGTKLEWQPKLKRAGVYFGTFGFIYFIAQLNPKVDTKQKNEESFLASVFSRFAVNKITKRDSC
jgi:hypothetical protein